MNKELNGYELSRRWFDWSFENPEKINPNHSAIYFFAIEHCNRLGWKEKFGFPTQMTMDAIGIKKHQTYIKYFEDLCEWGFFKLVQKSSNQYSANIISLMCALPKNGKALDKANIKHGAKQTQSSGQSNSPIDKQLTIEQVNNKNNQDDFNFGFIKTPFFPAMMRLMDYRKSIEKEFKTQMSLEAGYRELLELSSNDPAVAELIVDQSISNQWQGVFELKAKKEFKPQSNSAYDGLL